MRNPKATQAPLAIGDQKGAAEIRQYFDKLSIDRNETIRANPIIQYEQELRAEAVLGFLAAQPGERILDIGCGNARDIAEMVASGADVVGVDLSRGMVEQARRDLDRLGLTGVPLVVGNATQLEFADGSFDKVLCSEVIEHIPEVSLALRDIWRVLKPGGRLILSTPNKASWYGIERYWIWQALLRRTWSHPCDEWRTMSDVTKLLRENRFEPCDEKSVCFVPGFLITYFLLPSILQKLLINCLKSVEPLLRRWVPKSGYTICVVATRSVQ